jgi:isohexenylglutaconyl-CoA hydratase
MSLHAPALGPFQTLIARQQDGVLFLTLNQPASRNAMSLAMVRELAAALTAAETSAKLPAASESSEAVRVVVLRGAAGHFCAGGDLKDMAAARLTAPGDGPDPLISVSAAFGELCAAYARTPLATIAILEGSVLGGGFGLACAVDVAIATPTAMFGLPEVHRGVVPAQIAPFLVERLGYSQAKRLAISGARIDARTALGLGLVHELVSPSVAAVAGGADGAYAAALEAAITAKLADVLRPILLAAPGAIAATKALLASARFTAPGELVHHAAELFASAARSPEGSEGMTAFLQKRKPAWAPAESE